jgi:2-dehydro-3-deoxyglucarate aldolase
MDQTNNLKVGLERGKVLFGVAAETANPILIEVFGDIGLDWIWIDFEHKNPSPYDNIFLEGLGRAAECADIELMVRIPRGDPPLVRKVLDAGIRNIVLPRVKSAEEVKTAIEAGRFSYDGAPGHRGAGYSRSSGYGAAYDFGGEIDYHDVEDENILIGVLIENRDAVDNLDGILSVPEVGFVIPAPGDFSVSIGQPFDIYHPEVQEMNESIMEQGANHDVPVVAINELHFRNSEEAKEMIDSGAQLVLLGQDLDALRDHFEGKLDEIGIER